MNRACSSYGRYEKCVTRFRSENLKGRDHVKDLGTKLVVVVVMSRMCSVQISAQALALVTYVFLGFCQSPKAIGTLVMP
jgi:hypothetical protein